MTTECFRSSTNTSNKSFTRCVLVYNCVISSNSSSQLSCYHFYANQSFSFIKGINLKLENLSQCNANPFLPPKKYTTVKLNGQGSKVDKKKALQMANIKLCQPVNCSMVYVYNQHQILLSIAFSFNRISIVFARKLISSRKFILLA